MHFQLIAAVRSLYTLLLLFISFHASAQQLTGSIRDEQGKAIAFAGIMLTDTSTQQLFKTELADSAGHFTINSNAGATNLVITAQGYTAQNLKLAEADVTQPLTIILQQISGELGEVTVASSKPLFERKTDR